MVSLDIPRGLHLEVVGTGSYLPEEIIPNEYFLNRPLHLYNEDGSIRVTKIIETPEEILNLVGIRERRRAADNETPSDMGYRAAVRAIETAGIKADSLVGIIFATVTEDSNFPNAAQKVQRQLGVKNCFAYDVANACAGFPEICTQANARVLKKKGNYLCIAAEKMTSMIDRDDANSHLFGDGAGAFFLSPTDSERGILASYSVSNPFDGKDRYIFRDVGRMCRMPNGKGVLNEAVREMLDSVKKLKEEIGWECPDFIIPHQANLRIVDGVAKRSPQTHVINNIEYRGNMSSATCPIAFDECLRDGRIVKGNKVIVTSVGGGLTTAAIAVQM